METLRGPEGLLNPLQILQANNANLRIYLTIALLYASVRNAIAYNQKTKFSSDNKMPRVEKWAEFSAQDRNKSGNLRV